LKTACCVEIRDYSRRAIFEGGNGRLKTQGSVKEHVTFEIFQHVVRWAKQLQSVSFDADTHFFREAGEVDLRSLNMQKLETMSVSSSTGRNSALLFKQLKDACPQLKTVESLIEKMSCEDLLALSKLPLTHLKICYKNIAKDSDCSLAAYKDLRSLTAWSPTLQEIEIHSSDDTVLPDEALEAISRNCTKLRHLVVVTHHSPWGFSECDVIYPTSKGIASLAKLPELEHLELSSRQGVTGAVIELFAKHKKLQHLKLDERCDMSSQVLDWIPVDTSLQTLVLPVRITRDRAKEFIDQRKSLQKFSFGKEFGGTEWLIKNSEERKECKDEKKSSQ
jgi:hypothetical protein